MRVTEKEDREWKARVNVRDNFTCQDCGKKGNEAHHIKPWKENPELRLEVSNGKTLCLDCHKNYSRGGKPKIKEGKIASFYLSFEALEILKEKSHKHKKSMSEFIENLIRGKK
jgi:hypothetical protein